MRCRVLNYSCYFKKLTPPAYFNTITKATSVLFQFYFLHFYNNQSLKTREAKFKLYSFYENHKKDFLQKKHNHNNNKKLNKLFFEVKCFEEYKNFNNIKNTKIMIFFVLLILLIYMSSGKNEDAYQRLLLRFLTLF